MKRTHVFLALALIGGCVTGGANLGGRQAGNPSGGNVLALGDIAVDPLGRYFVSRADGRLVVGDLVTSTETVLSALGSPDLLAFWTHTRRPGFFLVTWHPITTGHGEVPSETVASYDLETKAVVWTADLAREDGRIDVSPDGTKLALTASEGSVVVLDAATGHTAGTVMAGRPIADLDFLPDGARFVVTGATERDAARTPWTTLTVHATTDARELCRVTVPNCSSPLVLSHDGARAFLAPTLCGRDPVSVIDLTDDACVFHGNLPGFGPVALSPDGGTVVAFMDRDANDPSAPALPEAVRTSADRYHLMFIDTGDLSYETSPLGASLPRYTFTPDGRSLLVDSSVFADDEIVILDVEARTSRRVSGQGVRLDEYALTPDARHAFIVDLGLFDLDIPGAHLRQIPLSFTPVSINMTPGGGRLLLKSSLDGRVFVYSVDGGAVTSEVTCPTCSL